MACAGPINPINETALHWAMEVADGEMTPDSRAEMDAWLAADTRHRGAFVRARAWIRATEDAVIEAGPARGSIALVAERGDTVGPDEIETLPLRRGWFPRAGRAAVGGALAASLVAVILTGTAQRWPFPHVQATANATLADGSTVSFSPDARIEVALSAGYRRITLLSGEATFHVAKDKARPFMVQSGGVYAQATGTIYSVRRMGKSGGAVKVTQGSVLVWARDERDQAVLLHAGGTLTLDPGPVSLPRPMQTASAPAHLPPPALAQISLDNVTIKAAAARFNRLNSTKIVVTNSRIGGVTITGLYKASDPEQFATAAATIANGSIQIDHEKFVIIMK